MTLLAPSTIHEIQNKIWTWWNSNKRKFPWRETNDPYFILISEMMLQQTQAVRVIPKYLEFIEKFDSIDELSIATNKEVLMLWSGLGYNKRAIWLRDAAKYLSNHSSAYRSPSELIKLKGIGKYTSYSIPIFAFNMDFATVDINIKKILIYEGLIPKASLEREFYDVANLLVPLGKSRNWHNALMDYGSAKYSNRKYSLKTENRGNAAFKGSNRYYRGLIIKELTNLNPQKISFFQERYPITQAKLSIILTKMELEGLIRIKDDIVKL